MKRPNILVVGSFVMDLIVSTDRAPESGETVLGKSFITAPGGKGANQAVQCARMGADVTMVGKVGPDSFGRELIASAQAAGVCTAHVGVAEQTSSSIGNIVLEDCGDGKSRNRIIVVPGANFELSLADVAFLEEEIVRYDMVILQLEIPMEVNELVARYAFDRGVPVMLNSAPSAPLSVEFLKRLTYISPNEHEAADLTGVAIHAGESARRKEDARRAASTLQDMGVKNVIITLGSAGSVLLGGGEYLCVPAVDVVEVKDPTAAGDSFVGTFCTGVCAGLTHAQALDLASYAATLTVSRMGAQPSLPTVDEVVSLMRAQNFDGFDPTLLNRLKREE